MKTRHRVQRLSPGEKEQMQTLALRTYLLTVKPLASWLFANGVGVKTDEEVRLNATKCDHPGCTAQATHRVVTEWLNYQNTVVSSIKALYCIEHVKRFAKFKIKDD